MATPFQSSAAAAAPFVPHRRPPNEVGQALTSLPHILLHPKETAANLKELTKQIRDTLGSMDPQALKKLDKDLYRLVDPVEYNRLSSWWQARLTVRVAIRYGLLAEAGIASGKIIIQTGKGAIGKLKNLRAKWGAEPSLAKGAGASSARQGAGSADVVAGEGSRPQRTQITVREGGGLPDASGTAARFTTMGGSVGPEFNPQQLQRILQNLERQGVVIDTGADARRLLDLHGAGAMYVAGNGSRGTLILRPGATRLQVMEELVHHGQHLRAGLQLPMNSAELTLVQAQRELQAQDILLRIPQNRNWIAEEIARITANRRVWAQELLRLSGR